MVRREGTVTIATLAKHLGVSQESIRRDVKPMTLRKELVKVHGAVTVPFDVIEASFDKRMRENADAKRAIARHMADKIADGDSIMLDTGTTTSVLARELLSKHNLTIVTNSSDVARTLATLNGNKVFMAGGELRGDNGAAFGASATEFVRRFNVRHAIISIGAISAGQGAMDYNLEEAEFARAVLAQGEVATIITDDSKFNRSGLVKVCDFDAIDVIVTNLAPPAELGERLKEAAVSVELAEAE
jgi:DeoR family glycerol-3-phosphate regulon repressor